MAPPALPSSSADARRVLAAGAALLAQAASGPAPAGLPGPDLSLLGVCWATGDVAGVAACLTLVPEQWGVLALDLAALAAVDPALAEARFPRARARALLESRRVAWTGRLVWALEGDAIACYGVRLALPTRAALRDLATARPAGWRLPLGAVSALLDRVPATVVHEQPGLWAAAIGAMPMLPPPVPVAFTLRAEPKGAVTAVSWQPPFAGPAAQLREALKALDAEFQGGPKHWTVLTAVVPAVVAIAATLPGVDLGTLAQVRVAPDHLRLAEDALRGVRRFLVLETWEHEVSCRLRGRDDAWWRAVTAHGGTWDASRKAVTLKKAALGGLLAALEALPQVDASALVAVWDAHQGEARAALAARRAIAVPERVPTGRALLPHEREGIAFLRTAGLETPGVKGAILADEAGLRKKAQAIIAAHEHCPTGTMLIVAPTRTRTTWAQEIHALIGPAERVQVVDGAGDGLDPSARWLVVAYELVGAHRAALAARRPVLAILDHASTLAALGPAKTRDLLGGAARAGAWVPGLLADLPLVWALSAQASPAAPEALYPILRAIAHPIAQKWEPYVRRYCAGEEVKGRWVPRGASRTDELAARLRDTYRRRDKATTPGLPPQLRQTVAVALTDEEATTYQRRLDDLLTTVNRMNAGGAGDARLRLDRMEEVTVLTQLLTLRAWLAATKVDEALALAAVVRASGGRVAILSSQPALLDRLEGTFDRAAMRLETTRKESVRRSLLEEFAAAPAGAVLLANPAALPPGAHITAVRDVLVVDADWTPGVLARAIACFAPAGELGTVTVRELIASHTFDGTVAQLLAERVTLPGTAGPAPSSATSPAVRARLEQAQQKTLALELLRRLRLARRGAGSAPAAGGRAAVPVGSRRPL